MRELTHRVQAAVAKAIASGKKREEIERMIYDMRQAALKEEEAEKTPPDDVPPAAA
jgi:hypothetical protein